jgi:hypothetical protein
VALDTSPNQSDNNPNRKIAPSQISKSTGGFLYSAFVSHREVGSGVVLLDLYSQLLPTILRGNDKTIPRTVPHDVGYY